MVWIKAFLSGFAATLLFHQGLFTVFWWTGLVPMAPYNFSPVPPFGVPAVLSLAFFGGLWGVGLWGALRRLAGPAYWLGHLIAGALGPTAVAMWVVFPLKNIEVTAQSWIGGGCLNGFWGLGVALGMRLMKEGEGAPPQAEEDTQAS